jgi:hypothetical protein
MDLREAALIHRQEFNLPVPASPDSAIALGSEGSRKIIRLPSGSVITADSASSGAIALGQIVPIRAGGRIDALRHNPPPLPAPSFLPPSYDSLDLYLIQDVSPSYYESLPTPAGIFANLSSVESESLKKIVRARTVRWGLGSVASNYKHERSLNKDPTLVSAGYTALQEGAGDERQLDAIAAAAQNPLVDWGVKAFKVILLITDEPDQYSDYRNQIPALAQILKERKIAVAGLLAGATSYWGGVSTDLEMPLVPLESDLKLLIEAIKEAVEKLR